MGSRAGSLDSITDVLRAGPPPTSIRSHRGQASPSRTSLRNKGRPAPKSPRRNRSGRPGLAQTFQHHLKVKAIHKGSVKLGRFLIAPLTFGMGKATRRARSVPPSVFEDDSSTLHSAAPFMTDEDEDEMRRLLGGRNVADSDIWLTDLEMVDIDDEIHNAADEEDFDVPPVSPAPSTEMDLPPYAGSARKTIQVLGPEAAATVYKAHLF